MMMVKAMTITVDSLLSRPKLDYDVAYDATVKGASVVVFGLLVRDNFSFSSAIVKYRIGNLLLRSCGCILIFCMFG